MESHPAVLPVFLQRRRNHSFVYLCNILADNYLEKRAEDLLKILEIVPWVASGMNALHNREYYDGLILCNRQLIGLLSSGWFRSLKTANTP